MMGYIIHRSFVRCKFLVCQYFCKFYFNHLSDFVIIHLCIGFFWSLFSVACNIFSACTRLSGSKLGFLFQGYGISHCFPTFSEEFLINISSSLFCLLSSVCGHWQKVVFTPIAPVLRNSVKSTGEVYLTCMTLVSWIFLPDTPNKAHPNGDFLAIRSPICFVSPRCILA